MACIKDVNTGKYLFPQRCFCTKLPNHKCCKQYNENKAECDHMANRGEIIFPTDQIAQLTYSAANGIYNTSNYLRTIAIIVLVGIVAFFIVMLAISKSSYFPESPSNIEINRHKLLRSQLNTK